MAEKQSLNPGNLWVVKTGTGSVTTERGIAAVTAADSRSPELGERVRRIISNTHNKLVGIR